MTATLQDFVAANASALRDRAAAVLRPLHVPDRDPDDPSLATLLRPPLGPQADLVTAALKALRRQRDVTLATEMGTGKTFCALAVCHGRRARRVLVACPPHLARKWEREILATVPGAAVTVMAGGRQWLSFATESDRERTDRPTHRSQESGLHGCGSLESAVRVRKGIPGLGPEPGRQDRRPEELGLPEDARGGPEGPAATPAFFVAPHTSLKLPRRGGITPAKLFGKRLRKYFDVLVLDESHQLKAAATRAGRAAHHLIAAAKKVVLLTGTLTAGRAGDLFPTLFRLVPGRLKALGYGHQNARAFAERYGRVETTVRTHRQPGRPRDRTRRRARERPGVLPGLFGEVLADRVLFLPLRDLGVRLPAHDERAVAVALPDAMRAAYDRLAAAVLAAVGDLSRAGRGRDALAFLAPAAEALLTWPDDPTYCEPLRAGSRVVCRPDDLDPGDALLPKEARLREDVEAELREGRQVWVFVTRDRVRRRLEKALADLAPAVLTAAVPTGDREAWVRRHGPAARVVLSHPKLVETGLELFGDGEGGAYNFCSLFWYGTGYELNTLRQASARHWRIRQTRECRTRYYVYAGTAQEVALRLMGKKLAAAKLLEGRLDGGGLLDLDDDGRLDLAVLREMAEALHAGAA